MLGHAKLQGMRNCLEQERAVLAILCSRNASITSWLVGASCARDQGKYIHIPIASTRNTQAKTLDPTIASKARSYRGKSRATRNTQKHPSKNPQQKHSILQGKYIHSVKYKKRWIGNPPLFCQVSSVIDFSLNNRVVTYCNAFSSPHVVVALPAADTSPRRCVMANVWISPSKVTS